MCCQVLVRMNSCAANVAYSMGFKDDQDTVFCLEEVNQVVGQLDAILAAGTDYYRLEVKTSEGQDPWSLEFQFKRVDDLWPDLFSRVEHPDTKPTDPFDPENLPYFIASMGNRVAVLSLGPNRRLDVSPAQLEEALEEASPPVRFHRDWTYSPTNGSKSGGDLFALGKYRD